MLRVGQLLMFSTSSTLFDPDFDKDDIIHIFSNERVDSMCFSDLYLVQRA